MPETVIDQTLMQPRVKTPNRNQLRVIAGFPRQVPKSDISCWANFHYRTEGTERQPPATHFLFQQLLVVATRVCAPIGITHYRRSLRSNNGRTQTFLRAANVTTPEHSVRRGTCVGSTTHQHKILAMLRGNLMHSLYIHRRVGVSIFTDRASIKDLEWSSLRNVFLTSIQLESGDAKL